jgi:signal transduction histidine kinase
MGLPYKKYTDILSGFTLRETVLTVGVLIAGLLLTILTVFFNRQNIKQAARQDFEYSCNQLRVKIETRLDQHAQLLRGGKGLYTVSDTITREKWRDYYATIKLPTYLPGIQGFGYSQIIRPGQIRNHEERFRKVYADYKPDYKIYPEGQRDLYSSIIFLEPHNERNKAALGYDMFNDPVRNKAMVLAMDSNSSILSGKVTLVQEIDDDVQPGVLMYIPDYKPGMPIETIDERRAAIRGWIYSPYRMKDLMHGILGSMGRYEHDPVMLEIYDDTLISENSRLYDSRLEDSLIIENPNLKQALKAEFNGKTWTLVFTGRKDEMSIFHHSQIFILFAGVIISILLFILSLLVIRSNTRAKQIQVLNTQLEKLNADKDRFMTILSHDLKSPFTSILGFLELLSSGIRKYDINQIESHVNTINDAAKNTFHLLEDLLLWTRAHSGKIPFNPQTHLISELYLNLGEILKPMADAKKISMEFIDPGDLRVRTDKNMFLAIMRNIISNAIKFTIPGGFVRIKTDKESDGVKISVADNGVGIDPLRISSIFNIAKIHPTTGTAGEKGSGLGLLLCREFIENHGGTIWVTSEPGKGTTFSFTLPDQ